MNQSFMFDHTMRELFEYPDPSVPFTVWTSNTYTFADRSIVYHWHNEFEYGVLLSGELDYIVDRQHIKLRQGDAIFINANAMHMAARVGDRDDVAMFTVSFLPSLFTGGNDGTIFRKYFQPILQSPIMGFPIERATQEGESIIGLLREVRDLDDKQTDNYELLCISLIGRIWSLTRRYIKEHQREFIPFSADHRSEKKAKDIMIYIHEHYAENIRVHDIARHTGISRSECFRSFQRYTNKNPVEYLTEYRLAHAANLLKSTDKSVTQIATECGFSSSSYFGKIFKKKYAITPSLFRSALSKA